MEVENLKNNAKKVEYNVSMSKTLGAESAAIDRLTGLYINEKDSTKTMELFRKDNQLWMKSDPFGMNLDYVGNNTFTIPGMSLETLSFVFEILPVGAVKLKETFTNDKGVKEITSYIKDK